MSIEQSIPHNQLTLSKANVRRTGASEGIAELAASIAAHGLWQNLNVLPSEDGKRFEVVAGGRRLRAMKMPAKAGSLAKDAPAFEDTAARLGVTPAVVKQRLELANVSPKLRALFRKGEMGLEHVMALAISNDHKAQEAAWKNLPEWNREPDSLKTP